MMVGILLASLIFLAWIIIIIIIIIRIIIIILIVIIIIIILIMGDGRSSSTCMRRKWSRRRRPTSCGWSSRSQVQMRQDLNARAWVIWVASRDPWSPQRFIATMILTNHLIQAFKSTACSITCGHLALWIMMSDLDYNNPSILITHKHS